MGLGSDEVVGLGLRFWWLGIMVAASWWFFLFCFVLFILFYLFNFYFILWWWWLAVASRECGCDWSECGCDWSLLGLRRKWWVSLKKERDTVVK